MATKYSKETYLYWYELMQLIRQFELIVKKEHQQAHIQEWEFIQPKFDAKSN